MAKVILICGKIASGKTEYAKKLVKEKPAVLLSCDEIKVALFGTDIGNNHKMLKETTQKYLFQKAVEIVSSGINVVLDWGFRTAANRKAASDFFKSCGIEYEWHYLNTSSEVLKRNLHKRNQAIKDCEAEFYYFDDAVADKFWDMFEEPSQSEIDVWVRKV